MERASRLIGKLPERVRSMCEDLACAAWPMAVGKKSRRIRAPRAWCARRLIVEVEDQVWQRQLFALSGQILTNLEKQLGQGMVEDLEFRVVPPRRDRSAPKWRSHRLAFGRSRPDRRPRDAQHLQGGA